MSAARQLAGPAPLARATLRSGVRDALVARILRGELKPGDRVNETTLGAELGVSATPVREALLSLEGASFLESSPGKGFTVRGLSEAEVRDVYPILATLEGLALRTAGRPPKAAVAAMRSANARLRRATRDPDAAIAADSDWHRSLLAACPNAHLLALVESLRFAARRYEHAFMREAGDPRESAAQHDAILKSLESGALETAAKRLESNWTSSIEPLVSWLHKKWGQTPPASANKS